MDGVVHEISRVFDRSEAQIYVPNEFIPGQIAKYPNSLFGASINPNRENSVELLEKVNRQGAILIK